MRNVKKRRMLEYKEVCERKKREKLKGEKRKRRKLKWKKKFEKL